MVSRRNFAAITAMMFVICFLFLLPQYVKETNNPYSTNIYAAQSSPTGQADVWQQGSAQIQALREQLNAQAYTVAFVGDPDSRVGYAVSSWAQYNKKELTVCKELSELKGTPNLVILEAGSYSLRDDLRTMQSLNEQGVTMVFADLPSPAEIRKYPMFRSFIGIQRIVNDSTELAAIRLFPGFLLGGERIYGLETEQDRELMDLNLQTPWYRLSNATEVYVMGELSEDIYPARQYRNEQLPPLIWRHSLNSTNIFVVNGDYLAGNTGIGMLSAIVAEDEPYYLYPVINAQILTVANFPGMADENGDKISAGYGKGLAAITRDLLWPSLESMSEINDFRMTCFEMPQYDYADDKEPDSKLISYYLKLMRERNAEAGISLQHNPAITMADKWNIDLAYLDQDAKDYDYSAAFLTEPELEEFASVSDSFRSLSVFLQERDALVFFQDDTTLCQAVTHDLLNYSFSKDLELRSVETALGYTNAMLDMLRVSWPEEGEPGWEVYYEVSASNLHTYWRRFNQFDHLTLSESDARIRNFLCMDYVDVRAENTITLEIANFAGGADFILRTHKEIIDSMTGGSFVRLESGAWLIHAEDAHVELNLRYGDLYEY